MLPFTLDTVRLSIHILTFVKNPICFATAVLIACDQTEAANLTS